jgi:flagellar L-ring protein precursor FlgH
MSLRFAAAATLVLSLGTLPLGACSTVAETVRGPQMSAVAYPAKLMPVKQEFSEPAGPASANTLWRTGARAFFHDQRAHRVGDILTVLVNVNDNATVSNETATDRTSSTDNGITHLFGLESSIGKILPGSPDPAHLVQTGGATSHDGKGSVSRSEAVSLTIAAVVTAVMPNGNMMIQGRQEVRVNQELRELTVADIVRPEDITAANTIRHEQIAEARVSYGGRGSISRVQKVPVGQALVEQFSPF